MAEQESIPHLKSLNIIPVTISYEYESCDQLKAREWALSEEGNMSKNREDFKVLFRVTQFYERFTCNLEHRSQINGSIDLSMNINDQLTKVCQIIDR